MNFSNQPGGASQFSRKQAFKIGCRVCSKTKTGTAAVAVIRFRTAADSRRPKAALRLSELRAPKLTLASAG